MRNLWPLLQSDYQTFSQLLKASWFLVVIPLVINLAVGAAFFISFIILIYASTVLMGNADERCGGQFLLASFPVERGTIVTSRYLQSLFNLIIIVAATTLLSQISFKLYALLGYPQTEIDAESMAMVLLVVGLLYIAIALPLNICFSATKARYFNIILYVALFCFINPVTTIHPFIENTRFIGLPIIVIFILSYFICLMLYRKKQYI